jgi:serine/threonine-protein kinase
MLEHLREATQGDYEILIELGSGGMATVFLAHDLQLDRKVAIKLMHPALISGEGMVERFLLEARTAASLSHPNIIPIYAVRVEEDLLFFVMKFVEGRPLDSIVKKEAPLPEDMVRQIISEVAVALGYAHQRGVIHRDIKPANIMISTDGQPILTDFGIAKVADKQGLTMTGATIGTPTYMSPEQCNALPLTGASDQYSLGVMAYEMLTGRPPFDAESVMTIMYKHINEPIPPIRNQLLACPPDLADTIERMVAKDPAQRFPTIEEVARVLERPTTTSENKVRTQLMQFALAGPNRELLKRVSTPRSPIPSLPPRLKTRAVANTAVTPSRSRMGWMLGGAAVLVAGIALAITQPWNNRSAGSDSTQINRVTIGAPDVAIVDSPATVAPPPVDSTPQQSAAQSTTTTPAPSPPRPVSRPPATSAAPATARVATVRVSGAGTLNVGASATLTAEPFDDQNRFMGGRSVSWSSSAVEIVSVSPGGQVTAKDAGRAIITATIDGVSQAVTITVAPEAIAYITVMPQTASLNPGEATSLSARIRAASGRALDRPMTWSSSAPSVASVSSDVRVTGQSAGTAVISATSGSQSGTATITVNETGPTDAEVRAQVAQVIQAYASALQDKNISRVRQIYPGIPSAREQQLRQALPDMDNLQVRLTIGQVDLAGDNATARVSGSWIFSSGGRRNTLPADNTYLLERRGSGWVITDIR